MVHQAIIPLAASMLVGAGSVGALAAVIHVNHAATGSNTGASWADAFTDLQAALAASNAGDEIWVAAGTYKPAPPNGPRGLSFHLRPSVGLYGGFAGHETSREQRDWQSNVTTLSGDLNGDDGPPGSFTNMSDNSFNVVAAIGDLGPPGAVVLDGFTIRRGNSTSAAGGVYVQMPASLRIANCTFTGNFAQHHGGALAAMRWADPSPSQVVIEDCRFERNAAGHHGGAVSIRDFHGWVRINRCAFIENHLTDASWPIGGAALAFSDAMTSPSDPHLVENCVFIGNRAKVSSAVSVYTATVLLRNALIARNEITAITPLNTGALLLVSSFNTQVINCTIADNTAPPGGTGGVRTAGGGHVGAMTNCIVFGNTPAGGPQMHGDAWSLTVTFSNIGGGWSGGGTGNIDADPLFVNPSLLNFRLRAVSPCVDAGDNGPALAVRADLDGGPRIIDGNGNGVQRVDMGAYEHLPSIAGDVTGDGLVNVNDLLAVINAWGPCPPGPQPCPADIAPPGGDGVVNVNDLLMVINNWG